jgi:hypothetical protein
MVFLHLSLLKKLVKEFYSKNKLFKVTLLYESLNGGPSLMMWTGEGK